MAGDASFVRDGEKFTCREFFEAIEEARNVPGDLNEISEKCQERLNKRYSNGWVFFACSSKNKRIRGIPKSSIQGDKEWKSVPERV